MKKTAINEFEVSISTINWNTTKKLKMCIDSVLKWCKDINYEWFIIDNNSSDGDFKELIKIYSKYENIKFIKNDKNICGLARNKIIKHIKSKYLLFLQPDTILKNNAIRILIDFMENNDDAGAASAKLLNPDGTIQRYFRRIQNFTNIFFVRTQFGRMIDKYLFSEKFRNHYNYKYLILDSIKEVEQVGLICFILRKNFIPKNGIIHEKEFKYCYGDLDICKNIYSKKYKIYILPKAEIIHDKGSSWKNRPQLWRLYQFQKAEIKYFRKNYRKKLYLIKAILFLDYLLYYIRGFKTINRKNLLKFLIGIIKW